MAGGKGIAAAGINIIQGGQKGLEILRSGAEFVLWKPIDLYLVAVYQPVYQLCKRTDDYSWNIKKTNSALP